MPGPDGRGAGKIVSLFPWGRLSSQAVSVDPMTGRPSTTLPTQTLRPDELYSADVRLSTLSEYCPVEKPGANSVEAVFTYADLGGWPELEQHFVARSQALPVEVGERRSGNKPPPWRLVPR